MFHENEKKSKIFTNIEKVKIEFWGEEVVRRSRGGCTVMVAATEGSRLSRQRGVAHSEIDSSRATVSVPHIYVEGDHVLRRRVSCHRFATVEESHAAAVMLQKVYGGR